MKNQNKSLFWYGFKARLMKKIGFFCIISGMFLGAVLSSWVVLIFLLLLGIISFLKGSSSEYDYKRRGGHIIYYD